MDNPHMVYYDSGAKRYEEWFKNGEYHRLDGPASINYNESGTIRRERWYKDGKIYREDGPTDILYYKDNNKECEEWNLNGELHRLDGPACIIYHPSGELDQVIWYLCDEEYTQYQHKEILDLAKSITSRDQAIMNIRHESKYIRMKCQEVLSV